jgi:alcohol dehydrogenase (NADP+)
VAASHDVNAFINLLARDGNITMVGAPDKPLPVAVFGLIFGRRSFSGSLIGGIPGTQEMLDFCGAHNITADVEVIPIQKINEAYERMLNSDVLLTPRQRSIVNCAPKMFRPGLAKHSPTG